MEDRRRDSIPWRASKARAHICGGEKTAVTFVKPRLSQAPALQTDGLRKGLCDFGTFRPSSSAVLKSMTSAHSPRGTL